MYPSWYHRSIQPIKSVQVKLTCIVALIANSNAHLSVSITGIAGPDGGSEDKPVGTVYFGYALKGGSNGSLLHHFEGSREEIRSQCVATALKHLVSVLGEEE